MSVIGIDFGTKTCVISQAKRGNIETVLNENSKRQTQTIVSFQGNQRFMGEAAVHLVTGNFKNTITHIKRFIGKFWSDPSVQNDIQFCPNRNQFRELDNDCIGIEVNYNNENVVFTPEQICAMLLGALKSSTEISTGRFASDLVFSVPAYWTDHQRRSFIAACSIAEIDVLGLINDGTASAVAYGIWKSAYNQFDSSNKEHVMFVDIGYANTQVTIASYIQGKVNIVANTFDSNLGGRNIDLIIAQHFSNEFQMKNKSFGNPIDNPKAFLKLIQASEKAKHTLTPTGVTEVNFNIEYLIEDIDFNSKLLLNDFNEMIAPLVERLTEPITKALKIANLKSTDLHAVELLGGTTRIRSIRKKISSILNLDPEDIKPQFGLSTTQNADECVSRGCALRCAMLSPSFRVKEFVVKDTIIYPICLSWEQTEAKGIDNNVDQEGEEEICATMGHNSITLFESKREVPMIRRIIFRRREPFEIQGSYTSDVAQYLPTYNKESSLCSFRISGLCDVNSDLPPKIRVDFKHDEFGMFQIVKAEQLQEIQVKKESPNKKPDEKDNAENNNISEDNDKSNEKVPPKTDDQNQNNDEKDTKSDQQNAVTPKKKFKLVKLKVESVFNNEITDADILNARAREQGFKSLDKLIKDTMDSRNNLESFIYEVRSSFESNLGKFATQVDFNDVTSICSLIENWLYSDESESASKATYDTKI